MKLLPQPNQVLGRIAITKTQSDIIVSTDPTKGVSKFLFVESVGEEVKGIRPGDFVLPRIINNIWLRGGRLHRGVVPIDEIVCTVRDVPLSDFVDKDGKPFVADEEASAEEARPS
jgi:hypothetical protein